MQRRAQTFGSRCWPSTKSEIHEKLANKAFALINDSSRPCPFCRTDVATTQRWLTSCPVSLLFFSLTMEQVLQRTDLITKQYTAKPTAINAKTTHTLHRVALARGAIGQEASPIVPTISQKEAIKQLIAEHTHRTVTEEIRCPCLHENNLG